MRESYAILRLTFKYWLQGDSWSDAKVFATFLVRGFYKKLKVRDA